MKADTHLFSRMYISCQVRQANMSDFFRHENHAFPPSLSEAGKLCQGSKSDIVDCLLNHGSKLVEMPAVSAKVFDGAALVHMLMPKGSKSIYPLYVKAVGTSVSYRCCVGCSLAGQPEKQCEGESWVWCVKAGNRFISNSK